MKKIVLLLVLISLGCGSKIKKSEQTETEKKQSESLKYFDSVKKMETHLVASFEEKQRKLREEFNQLKKELETETTVTETTEIDVKEPTYIQLNDGRFLNVNNGKITETKVTTNKVKQTDLTTKRNIEINEKAQKQIDSLNNVITAQSVGIEIAKEYIEKTKTKKDDKKVVNPLIPSWVWLIVLLVIVLIYIFRKWIGTTFPFLNIVNRFKG